MRFLLVTFSFLTLAACTTVEFVRKDFTPTKMGVIRHVPPGSETSKEKYRNLVKEKATDFCGGEYKVVREYQERDSTGTSTGIGTGFGFGRGGVGMMIGGSTPNTTMYNFTEFTCVTQP